MDILGSPADNFHILIPYLLNLGRGNGEVADEPRVSMWIDNWVRLGVVEVAFDEKVSGNNRYDWVIDRPEYFRLKADEINDCVDFIPGVLRSTSLGREFFKAVS